MTSVTAFFEDRVIARGEREAVTRLVEERYGARDHGSIHVFEDETGRVTDLDYWDASKNAPARGRGRPKLGVVAREVTLLPRQWEWLGRQPGGASAAIRRLVEDARKSAPGPAQARDAAYRFMSEMCGDRPGYEEALRALYRGERERFDALIAAWPEDVRSYIASLLGPASVTS
jgi:hypothetical protein